MVYLDEFYENDYPLILQDFEETSEFNTNHENGGKMMPTGYTAELDDKPDLTTAKWVTETLSREFGILFFLRDGPYGFSEDKIEAYLKKRDHTKYYKGKLEEKAQALEKLHGLSDEYWTQEHASAVEKVKECNRRSIGWVQWHRQHREVAKQSLIKLRDNTEDEITRNMAEFGLSQLELVKRDREPDISEIPSLEKLRADQMASLNRDARYYLKKIEWGEKAHRDRLLVYRRIRSEVARILEVQSSASSTKE